MSSLRDKLVSAKVITHNSKTKVTITICKLTIMSLELAIAIYKLAIVTKSQNCKI